MSGEENTKRCAGFDSWLKLFALFRFVFSRFIGKLLRNPKNDLFTVVTIDAIFFRKSTKFVYYGGIVLVEIVFTDKKTTHNHDKTDYTFLFHNLKFLKQDRPLKP